MQRYRHRLDRMVCDEKGEYVHVMDLSQLQAKLARLRWKLVSEGLPENGAVYEVSNGIWIERIWLNGVWCYGDSSPFKNAHQITHFREIILPGEEGNDE